MAEDREFIVEVVIRTNDLFPHIRGSLCATLKFIPVVRGREDSSLQQRLRIWIQQGCRNRVLRELLAKYKPHGRVLLLQRRRQLARLRHCDRGATWEDTAVSTRQRNSCV